MNIFIGKNSAGKSSIVELIALVVQSVIFKNSNSTIIPSADDPIVDFGDFRNIINEHNLKKPFKIIFHFDGYFCIDKEMEKFKFHKEILKNLEYEYHDEINFEYEFKYSNKKDLIELINFKITANNFVFFDFDIVFNKKENKRIGKCKYLNPLILEYSHKNHRPNIWNKFKREFLGKHIESIEQIKYKIDFYEEAVYLFRLLLTDEYKILKDIFWK